MVAYLAISAYCLDNNSDHHGNMLLLRTIFFNVLHYTILQNVLYKISCCPRYGIVTHASDLWYSAISPLASCVILSPDSPTTRRYRVLIGASLLLDAFSRLERAQLFRSSQPAPVPTSHDQRIRADSLCPVSDVHQLGPWRRGSQRLFAGSMKD